MITIALSILILPIIAQTERSTPAAVRMALKESGATVKENALYKVLLGDKNVAFSANGDFGVTIEESWKGGKEKLTLLKGQSGLKELNFADAPDEWLEILDDLPQLEG